MTGSLSAIGAIGLTLRWEGEPDGTTSLPLRRLLLMATK